MGPATTWCECEADAGAGPPGGCRVAEMRVHSIRDAGGDRDSSESAVDLLVAKAQNGDAEAFEDLAGRYAKPIYDLAMKLVGDAEVAEELALETFARAYQDLAQFSGRSAFFTWLYRIATNLCFRHLQRTRRGQEDQRPPHEMDLLSGVVAEDGTVEQVLGKLNREALIRCLGRLSRLQRVVLFLFYFEGYTYLEISRGLSIPVNTVKSHVRRGTSRLRQALVDAGLGDTEEGGARG